MAGTTIQRRPARTARCPRRALSAEALERARDARQHQSTARRAEVIERTVREAAAAGERCSCSIHPGMTVDDLRALGGGCTDPAWSCQVLDRLRRKLGA